MPSIEQVEAGESEDSAITQADVTKVVIKHSGRASGTNDTCPDYLKSLDLECSGLIASATLRGSQGQCRWSSSPGWWYLFLKCVFQLYRCSASLVYLTIQEVANLSSFYHMK